MKVVEMHEQAGGGLSEIRTRNGETLSRSDLVLKGALAAGALYGLAAVGPYMRKALAAEGASDVDTLNYLLPFEYLQASIYNRGKSEVNDKDEKMSLSRPEKELMRTLTTEEGQHVAALRGAIEELGGKPVEKGDYAFAFREYPELVRLAAEIETTAVGAYNGAIPLIQSDKVRELAGSIVQVEGRHAATLLVVKEEEPAPAAFDYVLDENSAINQVERFTGVFPE